MPETSKGKVTYRVARKREELEQAFSLVYKEYASRRYIPKGYKSKLRLSIYNAIPSTTTLIAIKGKKVMATVTLIPDSPVGLPMDKIYKQQLSVLRKKHRRISECSQLAVDSSLFPKGWFSMFNFSKFIFIFRLFRYLLDYALYTGIEDFCIAINPKQQSMYKFIGFENIGGLKYYGNVNKAPAIAKRLDLRTYEKKIHSRRSLHKIFFGGQTPKSAFENKFTMKTEDLRYFFLEKSDMFEKTKKKQLKYIKSCYPGKETELLFKKHNLL